MSIFTFEHLGFGGLIICTSKKVQLKGELNFISGYVEMGAHREGEMHHEVAILAKADKFADIV